MWTRYTIISTSTKKELINQPIPCANTRGKKLSDKVSDLAGSPTSLTLDGLRLLERKTATVCTLLKASVYSIVLQQQIFNESEEQQQQEQQQEGGELGQEQFEEDEYYTRGGGRGGFDGDVTFEG